MSDSFPGTVSSRKGPGHTLADRQTSLVDLLDRLLASGAVISGDLTITIADVDLVRVSLRALVSSINENVPSPWERAEPLTRAEQ